MKKIFVFIFALLLVFSASSQQHIKTEQVFSKKTNFDFTNEWQFVSTDLYLFNSDRFNYLLNNMNPNGNKKRFFNKKDDQIKNIMVTAQLDGMGDLDALTYPIFNFIVTKNDDGDFQTQVNDPGAIRIVDNVSVSSINDYIGAKIKVSVYSDKNRPEIYKFIATQLQNASNFTAASTADIALEVVGEIGKMMQKDAAGQQYQFESTIRFYEEQNFDHHLHSITIFLFKPSNKYGTVFDTTEISEYFDTTQVASINKDKITQLIDYNLYPYIIAVNYRSKYKPEISDEITFDMLARREAKNEDSYKNSIISREIYIQEKSLINFLNTYAEFQQHVVNYELNYEAKITEDYTIQLFYIFQDYWKLKNSFNTIYKAFDGNPLFDNEFKQLYNRYLTKASLKFEGNSALRSIREHVETLYFLENNGASSLDSNLQENYIRKLRATNLPDREYNSDEAIITRHWINNIEADLFNEYFQPRISELATMEVLLETNNKVQKLLVQSSGSYCELCKTNVLKFSNEFTLKYDEYLYVEASKELNKTINLARTNIFEYSKKQNCIQTNIDSTANNTNLEYLELISSTLEQIADKRAELHEIVYQSNNFGLASEIQNHISLITSLLNEIEAMFESICLSNPKLCDCEKE